MDLFDLPLTDRPRFSELLKTGDISSLEHKIDALEQARVELTEGLDKIFKERAQLLTEKYQDNLTHLGEKEALRRELVRNVQMIQDIWAGPSWKIGRAFTYIPRKIKKFLPSPRRVFQKIKRRIPSEILFFFSANFFNVGVRRRIIS